jgi:hypothetical protein
MPLHQLFPTVCVGATLDDPQPLHPQARQPLAGVIAAQKGAARMPCVALIHVLAIAALTRISVKR